MATTILPPGWQVPEVLRERLGTQAGRQRAMAAEGHLLLVLHTPPKEDETRRSPRLFWRAPDGTWVSNELGTGINAVNSHLDQYAELIARLDGAEEVATSADEYFQIIDNLAPVYRAARNMHQALQDARSSFPEYHEIINLRDRAYEIQRTAELLFNGTKNALDYAIARRAEQQAHASRRMAVAAHRLNLLAGFFFPIATLTAIFGVNLRHGFEDNPPPFLFLTVVVLGLALGAVLTMFIMRPHDAPESPAAGGRLK